MTVKLTLFGITFPQSFITMIILFFGLGILFIYIGYKIKKSNPIKIESKTQVIIEAIFEFFNKMVTDIIGKENAPIITPIIMLLFLSIFIGNALSMFFIKEVAYNSTFAIVWGVTMFLVWNGYGIYKIGLGKFFKSFAHPNFMFVPLEIVGFFSKLLSITVRLIGNIASGIIMMSLIYQIPEGLEQISELLGWGSGILLIPLISGLSFYFSIFAPLIQALVFSMLSLGNISLLINEEE